MEPQGESTTMATSSTHEHEPPAKPTLLADQPLPHIFETLLNLQDDIPHLIQITLEPGSKIQEQGTHLKEVESLCISLQETQLDNRVGLRAIHNHILPQSKGKKPEEQGRISFHQSHRDIKPEKVSFRKDHPSDSESESIDENIRIREFFPRSRLSTSTPRKKATPAPAAPAAIPAPATPATTHATTLTIPKLSSPDGYDGKKKGRPARQWMARVLALLEVTSTRQLVIISSCYISSFICGIAIVHGQFLCTQVVTLVT
jgi:hypothetical protein